MTGPERRPPPAAGPGATDKHTIHDVQPQGSAPVDSYEVLDLIGVVAAGRYSPAPGSVGTQLLARHPACRWDADRSLAEFARIALDRQGLFWPMVLDADPATLTGADSAYIAVVWRRWVGGEDVFR